MSNNENKSNENKSNPLLLLKVATIVAALSLLWVLDAKLEKGCTQVEASREKEALMTAHAVEAKKMADKVAEITAALKTARAAEDKAVSSSAYMEGKLQDIVSLNREISLERDTLKEENSQLLTKLRDDSDREASLELTVKGANEISRSLYLEREALQLKLAELAEKAKNPLHWAKARWGSEQ